jgi:ferredoxin
MTVNILRHDVNIHVEYDAESADIALMTIFADTTACVGAGQCALVASTLFDQDDDGIVVVLDPDPTTDDDVAAALRAASLCPARAIRVTDR